MCECVVCNREFSSDDPKILAMGAYGSPKYLCDECAADFDVATLDSSFENIAAAMERIGNKMANSNPDKFTFDTVNGIMAEAGERAKLIKEGKYDFALDESKGDGVDFYDIPEELRETEEDRELDRADEESLRKFDQFYNALVAILSVAFVAFVAWRIIDTFFLK